MKRFLVSLLVVIIIGLACAAATGVVLYRRVSEPYRGYDGPEQFVDLPPGISTTAIGERLVGSGVVRDVLTFRIALWKTGAARRLRAGEYRFDTAISAEDVVRKIARGESYLRSLTFREGLTIGEMAAVFEREGFGNASDFLEAARDASLVRSFDPYALDLEGYLFPETYLLHRRASAADLVKMMVDRFNEVMTPDLIEEARAQGLGVREVVTLASLIEKETGQADERSLVSAVYRNRLRIRMALQCDPTVIYALKKDSRWKGNLTREHLAIDSPYNTYRYPGLPPGPIAAPGRGALEAAVRPADVPFLYFVSRNDGSHVFATTLREHNQNVYRYKVQFFRRGSR